MSEDVESEPEETSQENEDLIEGVEYKLLEVSREMGGILSSKVKSPENELNRLAKQGWKIVETIAEDNGGTQYIIFERKTQYIGSDNTSNTNLEAVSEPNNSSQNISQTTRHPFSGDNFQRGPTKTHRYFEYCPECESPKIWYAKIDNDHFQKCGICESEWIKVESDKIIGSRTEWKEIEGEHEGKSKSKRGWQ